MSKSFNVILRSSDKRNGDNNNYEITIPFSRMKKYSKLKVRSSWWNKTADYQTISGGYVKTMCEVRINFQSSSYDSREKTTNYLTLGIANLTGTGTNMRYWYDTGNSFEHVIDYPSSDVVNVQVRAVLPQASGTYFFVQSNGTTNDLTDCSEHVLYLEFTGIEEEN